MKRFIEGPVFHWIVLLAAGCSIIWYIGALRNIDQAPAESRATATASEQRMQRMVKPRTTIVTNKCSLDQAQRIWEVLNLQAPDKPDPGTLIPFANMTSFYDGKEWWCSDSEKRSKP